jgi:rod shape-determining protein MreC
MRRLLDIILFYKEYLLLITCVIVSSVLLASNDSSQMKSIRAATIVTVGFIQDALGFIPNYFDLREENALLRERNLTLSEELSRMREEALENERLRFLTDLKERTPFRYQGARVVGKNFQPLRTTVTIDAGTDKGLAVDMPVVTHAGLVGKIVATTSRYSVVQTLLHMELRTSAKVQRSRVDGILMWEGESALKLKNVAKTLDVKEGDLVVTSEYSSVFPSGITVGVVSRTTELTGDLFQTIEVLPAADLLRLEDVFVITQVPDTSRIRLEQRAAR